MLLHPVVFVGAVILFSFCFTASLKAQSQPDFRGRELLSSDRNLSDQFKAKSGSDRYELFLKLESLIRTAETANSNLSPDFPVVTEIIDVSDLTDLLGEPDLKIAASIFVYKLRPDANCKAYIGIRDDGKISFSTIKDCPN